jgi:hypothetical protein
MIIGKEKLKYKEGHEKIEDKTSDHLMCFPSLRGEAIEELKETIRSQQCKWRYKDDKVIIEEPPSHTDT